MQMRLQGERVGSRWEIWAESDLTVIDTKEMRGDEVTLRTRLGSLNTTLLVNKCKSKENSWPSP